MKMYFTVLWKNTEHNKYKWPRTILKFKQPCKYVTNIKLIAESIKIDKNVKSPLEYDINSELYKYAPEEIKLRLLKFLNKI
jgi:hypothetical protein